MVDKLIFGGHAKMTELAGSMLAEIGGAGLASAAVAAGVAGAAGGRTVPERRNVGGPAFRGRMIREIERIQTPGNAGMRLVLRIHMDGEHAGAALEELAAMGGGGRVFRTPLFAGGPLLVGLWPSARERPVFLRPVAGEFPGQPGYLGRAHLPSDPCGQAGAPVIECEDAGTIGETPVTTSL